MHSDIEKKKALLIASRVLKQNTLSQGELGQTKRAGKMEHPLLLIQISIQYNLQRSKLVKTMGNRMIYAFSISRKTSASVGSDGIAPFFVVVIAPHALANLIDSTSFFSSCTVTRYQISITW